MKNNVTIIINLEDLKKALTEAIKEGMQSLSHDLGQKIDSLGESLGRKIDDLGQKIDGLGESLGEKIDGLGQNLGQKIDSLGSKMDVLINHTRNIYMDLSETAFLNVFLEDLGYMGHKVSGVFVGDKVDYRVKVEKGKEKILYVEVEEVVVPSMVEEIIRKFEGIEKGEKWLLAKFIDSEALEMLKGTDINIYAYDPHKDSVGIIKGGGRGIPRP